MDDFRQMPKIFLFYSLFFLLYSLFYLPIPQSASQTAPDDKPVARQINN